MDPAKAVARKPENQPPLHALIRTAVRYRKSGVLSRRTAIWPVKKYAKLTVTKGTAAAKICFRINGVNVSTPGNDRRVSRGHTATSIILCCCASQEVYDSTLSTAAFD
jgi:hypothetical protein